MSKDLDLLIGFVLLMLAAGSVVAAGTHFAATVTGMRARFLRRAVEEILSQLNLSPRDARQLALFLLRHPWLCGCSKAPARFLHREQFVRLLLDLAADPSLLAGRLRAAFRLDGADDAQRLAEAIGAHALRMECQNPGEIRRHRDTRAIIEAMGPHPALAHIAAWYPQAMDRATQRYMRQTRTLTALLALSLVLATRLDVLEFFRLHPASHWPGIALAWLFLTLGTPYWYDRLKDLLRLRPAG